MVYVTTFFHSRSTLLLLSLVLRCLTIRFLLHPLSFIRSSNRWWANLWRDALSSGCEEPLVVIQFVCWQLDYNTFDPRDSWSRHKNEAKTLSHTFAMLFMLPFVFWLLCGPLTILILLLYAFFLSSQHHHRALFLSALSRLQLWVMSYISASLLFIVPFGWSINFLEGQ